MLIKQKHKKTQQNPAREPKKPQRETASPYATRLRGMAEMLEISQSIFRGSGGGAALILALLGERNV